MSDVPAGPVVTAACFFCCRRAMGVACTRHSLRPLADRGLRAWQTRTNRAAGTRSHDFVVARRNQSRLSPQRDPDCSIASLLARTKCSKALWQEQCGAFRRPPTTYCIAATLMPVGPRITTNSTGRKNRIIGTVSLGGRAAAFFSASFMRMSRFSCAMTRRL